MPIKAPSEIILTRAVPVNSDSCKVLKLSNTNYRIVSTSKSVAVLRYIGLPSTLKPCYLAEFMFQDLRQVVFWRQYHATRERQFEGQALEISLCSAFVTHYRKLLTGGGNIKVVLRPLATLAAASPITLVLPPKLLPVPVEAVVDPAVAVDVHLNELYRILQQSAAEDKAICIKQQRITQFIKTLYPQCCRDDVSLEEKNSTESDESDSESDWLSGPFPMTFPCTYS